MKKLFAVIILGILSSSMLMGCSENKNNTNSSSNSFMSQLNKEQSDALVFIIEEEKLARDVYTTLYQRRGNKKFYNILNAEENHQSKVALLLDKYNITNPTIDKDIGEYESDELTNLYQTLIQQGAISNTQAMSVGVSIEEKDIKDIQEMLGLYKNYPDITQTLESLLAGSERHLNAFLR